jgi:hypothetical protein
MQESPGTRHVQQYSVKNIGPVPAQKEIHQPSSAMLVTHGSMALSPPLSFNAQAFTDLTQTMALRTHRCVANPPWPSPWHLVPCVYRPQLDWECAPGTVQTVNGAGGVSRGGGGGGGGCRGGGPRGWLGGAAGFPDGVDPLPVNTNCTTKRTFKMFLNLKVNGAHCG